MEQRLEKYQGDPIAFAREVLRAAPWSKQAEILEALRDHPRVTVRSAHGVGKSWMAACAALWFLYTREPVAVLTTAPTHRQVKEILWREIRRLHAAANRAQRTPIPTPPPIPQSPAVAGTRHFPISSPLLPGRCLETALRVSDDRFALGLTTDEADRFQGFHAPHLLVVVDEASGVPEEIFDAIDGVLTTGECRLLLIGNPVQASGRFYQSHVERGWQKFAISALDSPNVAGVDLDDEEAVREPGQYPGLVTARWVAERRQQWGEDTPLYQSRVLGNFPDQADDSLIPLSWIEAALARAPTVPRARTQRVPAHPHHPRSRVPAILPHSHTEIGVDLARFGSCESALYVRRGDRVIAADFWRGLDLMQSAGRIVAMIRKHRPDRVKIDAIGLGAGVVDRLRELGFRQVAGVNVARPALDPDRFASLRDEIFFALRDRFQQGSIQLPADEILVAQLAAMRYGFTSSGQQKVESKDEMRARGLPSPDRADALALCFAPLPGPRRPVFLAGPARPMWPPLGRR
jgi:phage terminase large subunit